MEQTLAHHGVKGMQWGVRKDDHPGASSAVNKDARKDAKESARAKQFYGEGAGTRRKLIKASVEGKSRRDPTYKAAFDHHLANQNSADHASKARNERRRKDATASVKKNASRFVSGAKSESKRAGKIAGVLLTAAGTVYAHNAELDRMISDYGKVKVTTIRKPGGGTKKRPMTPAEKQLRDMGFGINIDY